MKTIYLILIFSLTHSFYGQETEDVYPLDDFFEDYFEARGLNLILMYKDPGSNRVIYTVDGMTELEKLKPKVLFLHETFNSYEKVTIQTWFNIDELWSLKDRYELINSWANPKYPAGIFWDSNRECFVLSVSMNIFSKTVSVRRIDDMYLGFIAALKDLNVSQKIKL